MTIALAKSPLISLSITASMSLSYSFLYFLKVVCSWEKFLFVKMSMNLFSSVPHLFSPASKRASASFLANSALTMELSSRSVSLTNNFRKSPLVSSWIQDLRLSLYRKPNSSATSLSSLAVFEHIRSIKRSSSVPSPFMAWCKSSASETELGFISIRTPFKKLSLKTLIRSTSRFVL